MVARSITGLEPKWFEFDGRIYVVTEDPLTDIVIQLVAEDPRKIVELNGGGNVFDPLDFEYPLSNTLRDSIYKLMLDVELKISSVPTDMLNDGQNSPTQNEN